MRVLGRVALALSVGTGLLLSACVHGGVDGVGSRGDGTAGALLSGEVLPQFEVTCDGCRIRFGNHIRLEDDRTRGSWYKRRRYKPQGREVVQLQVTGLSFPSEILRAAIKVNGEIVALHSSQRDGARLGPVMLSAGIEPPQNRIAAKGG